MAFTVDIVQPRVITEACSWQMTAGKVALSNTAGTTTIIYGLNSCGGVRSTTCPVSGGTYYFQLSWTPPPMAKPIALFCLTKHIAYHSTKPARGPACLFAKIPYIAGMQTVTAQWLHTIDELGDVPEVQLQWMIDNSSVLTIKEGEFFFRPGMACIGTYIPDHRQDPHL